MPRSKIICSCFSCGKDFYRWGGQLHAKYCSRLCNLRTQNTTEHQKKAGKAGGAVKIKLRGTGTKTYVKEYGRHQHRVVIEKLIGRRLETKEIVHHKDGNKHNNFLGNLEIMTRAEHARHHFSEYRESCRG